MFDQDDRALASSLTSKEEDHVGIPLAWRDLLRGSILVHNHPGGLPPSRQDFRVLDRYGVGRIEVVCRHGVFSADAEDDADEVKALRRASVWISLANEVKGEFDAGRLNLRTVGPKWSELLAERLWEEGFAVNYEKWRSST